MREIVINRDWYFHIEDEEYRKSGDPSKKDPLSTFGFFKTGEASGFAARRCDNLPWRRVNIPHDYVIELESDRRSRLFNGQRPVNESRFGDDYAGCGRTDTPVFPIAWYRKEFFINEDGSYSDIVSEHSTASEYKAVSDGTRYFLRFEGVYRDFAVWVNGVYIDRVTCGYLGVTFDITDQLIVGEMNSIAVRVDCSQYDGWWYDGGGIYRDVKLLIGGDIYCHAEDLYIHASADGVAEISAELTNMGETGTETQLGFAIVKDGVELCRKESRVVLARGKTKVSEKLSVGEPRLWDIDDPQLYTLVVTLDGEEELEISFGFKDVRFDAERGFFLNGRPRKLKGVCLHQDLAGVGTALTYELTYYKYKTMKDMGVNAVRTVHNPPSTDALDICDRLGILVMDETRMFGSSPEALRQVETLVRRDRNHASLLMWSIGNEEHTVQNNKWGARMARTVKRAIADLVRDPIVTYGANNGKIYEGINSEMELRGINYIRISSDSFHPDDYHKEHPHQAIFSSEEMSSLTARGVYKCDTGRGFVDAYGECGLSWSSTPMGYMKFAESRDYYCGGFVWTGFDYHGEPSPFNGNELYPEVPRNTSSNFGIVDLCGFPKDIYYYYRACWRDEPVLHLLPDWSFSEGEGVRVAAFTNCERVTLYINGREISTVENEPFGIPEWEVPFEAGELLAVGKRGEVTVSDRRRTGTAVGLRISTERCGEHTLAFVDAIDAYGDLCSSDESLTLTAEGAMIIGVGNGDPTSRLRESYFDEEERVDIPPLVCDKEIELPAAPFMTSRIEDKHPRFYDASRRLWRVCDAEERSYTFTAEFDADESYEFIDFSGILGEAHIFLNGVEIGATPAPCQLVTKRAYRFYCHFENGRNVLEVRVKSDGKHAIAVEGASFGKLVTPRVEHKLFSGRMLVILKGEGRLSVSSESGFTAECEIKA